MKGIQNLRVDYSGHLINMDKMKNNPIEEFKIWFEKILASPSNPSDTKFWEPKNLQIF